MLAQDDLRNARVDDARTGQQPGDDPLFTREPVDGVLTGGKQEIVVFLEQRAHPLGIGRGIGAQQVETLAVDDDLHARDLAVGAIVLEQELGLVHTS